MQYLQRNKTNVDDAMKSADLHRFCHVMALSAFIVCIMSSSAAVVAGGESISFLSALMRQRYCFYVVEPAGRFTYDGIWSERYDRNEEQTHR